MKIIKCLTCGHVYKESGKNECEKCGSNEVKELEYTTEKIDQPDIKKVWNIFEKEEIDSNTKTIKENFFGFKTGTTRAEIWRWFNEHYDGGIMELMTPPSDAPVKNEEIKQEVYKNNNQEKQRKENREKKNIESPDIDGDMRKIQRTFSPLYSDQESLMINAMMNKKECCVSYSGNRMLLNYVLPEIIATSMLQIQNVNAVPFLRQLMSNAYGLYMIHKNNQE